MQDWYLELEGLGDVHALLSSGTRILFGIVTPSWAVAGITLSSREPDASSALT